jgi:hypothetical protein
MQRLFVILLSCWLVLPLAAQADLPTVVWLEDVTAWVSFHGASPIPLANEEVFDAALSSDQTRLAYSVRDGIHIIDTTTQAEVQMLSISVVPPREDDIIFNVFERLHWINADQLLLAVGFASDEPIGGIGHVELPYYVFTLSSNELVPFTLPSYPAEFLFSPAGKHILVLASGEIGLPDSTGSATIFDFPQFTAQGDSVFYYPNYYLDESMGSNELIYPTTTWNATGDTVGFDITTSEATQNIESEVLLTAFPSNQVCRLPVGGKSTCLDIFPGREPVWNSDLSRFVYTPVSELDQTREPYKIATWHDDNTLTFQPLPTTITNLIARFTWLDNDTLLFHTRSQEPYALYQVTLTEGTSTQLLADAGSIVSVARLADPWLAVAHIPDGQSEITVSLFNWTTQSMLTLGTHSGRVGFFEGQLR